jgi:hypothetical protein
MGRLRQRVTCIAIDANFLSRGTEYRQMHQA